MNPLNLKPIGNAFLSSKRSARDAGLGELSILSDELIAYIWHALDALDVVRVERVSKSFYAFSRGQDQLFKTALLTKTNGILSAWTGSWRATFRQYLSKMNDVSTHINVGDVYSDLLYTPVHVAQFNPLSITSAASFTETIPRIDARTLRTSSDLPKTPCILTHAIDNWAACTTKQWTLSSLSERCRDVLFRAEAVLATLSTYQDYCRSCQQEDCPIYLFESDFVEKGRHARLDRDFNVPSVFDEDLFQVMGEQRPDYRWMIAGPVRSGSTFHKDPNNTSAWNAICSGSKLWITFPKEIIPPGVKVSQDMAEVHTPDSVGEWFINYYAAAKARYGPNAKDVKCRGMMQEGVCRAGEVFCIPSGYWHCVVNLEESVAITQNYVSKRELASVLHFLKTKPEQISGFKLEGTTGDDCQEENGQLIFERLCKALQKEHQGSLNDALKQVARLEGFDKEKKTSLWDTVAAKGAQSADASQEGFSFSFDL